MNTRRLVLWVVLGLASSAQANWRFQWSQQLPARKPAWEFTPRLPRDSAYEPVVAAGLVLVGCEHNGAVVAFDLADGRERWRFYTDGPIRFAPAVDGGRAYVGSDDGRLYALDVETGRLRWTCRGGPSDRRLIAHERLASVWPVSARPAAAGGTVFFVAGYWPTEGIFVHALNADTGQRIWVNGTAQFRPGGQVRVVGGVVHVDGHRGAAAFDAETGTAAQYEKPAAAPPQEGPPGEPPVKGKAAAWCIADDRLIVATAEGQIQCFAQKDPPPGGADEASRPAGQPADTAEAERVLAAAGVREGHALVLGLKDGALVEGLARAGKLHIVAVDGDARTVDAVRRRLDRRGLFDDHRLTVIAGDEAGAGLPPYVAGLIVSETVAPPFDKVSGLLRPYGGALVSRRGDELAVRRREGPPAGAADWTHEFADETNCLASADALVKGPLGFLWYGGPAADPRYYFNGLVDHQSGDGVSPLPPNAEVVQGRMVLQGPGLLAAVDVYTGRLLWEASIPRMFVFGGKGGGVGIHSKAHPEPWKDAEALKAEVPPTHQCRTSGFNFVSVADGVYVAAGRRLLRFDLADGKLLSSWPVPLEGDLCWGNIRLCGEVIVATVFRPQDIADAQAGHDGNGGDWAKDRMRMSHLLALDRRTGKLLWRRPAAWGFLNQGYAVGGNKVYCVDLIVENVLAKLRQGGQELPDSPPMLHALDLRTGKEAWSAPAQVVVKQLTYSQARDILVVPCRNRLDWKDGAWVPPPPEAGGKRKGGKDAPGLMRGFRGADGELLWQVEEAAYFEPHIITGDLIIDRYGWPYDLRTGRRHERTSPITGRQEPWNFRKGGCNHLIACPHMVTWRTAYYDLAGHSGAMQLAGLEAGCTPTFIPAGGVLSAGNFGTHFKRNRPTALCFAPMPDGEEWMSYQLARETAPAPIRRAGFNFGAPGDRLAPDGALWFAVAAKISANVAIQPKEAEWYQLHPSQTGCWIAASGVAGVSELKVPTWLYAGKPAPKSDGATRPYRVRLLFAEPQPACKPGQRIFGISLEGRAALEDFDVLKEAGGPLRPVAREFKGLQLGPELTVTFAAKQGTPILSGLELVAE